MSTTELKQDTICPLFPWELTLFLKIGIRWSLRWFTQQYVTVKCRKLLLRNNTFWRGGVPDPPCVNEESLIFSPGNWQPYRCNISLWHPWSHQSQKLDTNYTCSGSGKRACVGWCERRGSVECSALLHSVSSWSHGNSACVSATGCFVDIFTCPGKYVFLFWLQHNVWQQPPLAPKWVTKGLLLFSLFPPLLLFISFFGFGYFFCFVFGVLTPTLPVKVCFFSPLLFLSFLELGCRKLLASFICGVIKVSVYFQRGIFVVITTSTDITRHTYWNSKQ